MIYAGCTAVSVERRIDKIESSFDVAVTERWAGQDQPWQLQRFAPCTIAIDGTPVLTGYIDDYEASFTASEHTVRVCGRSKTGDLTECTPDISSGQFKGYNLAQIGAAVCVPFGITQVVETDASQTFPDATLQRGETAFSFLERLGRLAGVLLTDNELGNLVLTSTGTQRAGGTLQQGVNILAASGRLSARNRFSHYIVKGQRALGAAAGQSQSGGGTGGAPSPVATNLRAVAIDALVPRYRPKISLAEAQLDAAGMQRRANWERNYAFGRSTELNVTVLGWYDAAGNLWRINRLITATVPWCEVDQDLLISGVTFRIDAQGGRVTHLSLGPVEGFTPDTGQVRLKTKRGARGHKGRAGAGGANWDGAGGYP